MVGLMFVYCEALMTYSFLGRSSTSSLKDGAN